MAKSVKGKTESSQSAPKVSKEVPKKASSKSKKQLEEEDEEDDIDEAETTPLK